MQFRWIRAAAATVAVTLAAVACGGSSNGSSGSTNKPPYLLSISTDLSAAFSAVAGIPASEGFQAALLDYNSKGGINGHQIKFDLMDDRSDVQTGLANYQKALDSDSLGFFVNAASAIVAPVGAKAIQDHFVETSLGGYQGGIGVFPYTYSTNPTPPAYVDTLVKYAGTRVSNTSGAKMAYILYDSPGNRTYQPTVENGFKGKGWSVFYSQVVPQTTTDFSVAAGQIASGKPDIVVTNLLEAQLPSFVSAIRARGVTVPIENFNSNISDQAIQKVNDPELWLLRFTASTLDTSTPGLAAMKAAGKNTGHQQGVDNPFYVLGYVHGEVVAAALKKCGDSCTREKLNTALENTTVDSNGLMAGKPGYTPQDHTMPKGFAVVKWESAKGYPATANGFGFK